MQLQGIQCIIMPGYCYWCRWAPDVWCGAISCLGTRLGGSKMHALSPVRIYSHKSSGTYLQYSVSSSCLCRLGHCNLWPHVASCHISGRYRQRLSQLFSLWRHSHCDVIGAMLSITDIRTPYRVWYTEIFAQSVKSDSGWGSDCHVGDVQSFTKA